MARTVNVTAHAVRREEFLDAAQRLLETVGFERMSVQGVLEEVGASKGAFYHYFASKQALLEGVVERMADTVAAHLSPVAHASGVAAVEKLRRFFAALGQWKGQRRDLLIAVLRVWHSDDNAVARQKLRAGITERIAPLLATIARQGADEGAFATPYPEESARVVLSLIHDLNDRLADLLLAAEPAGLEQAERAAAATATALERILGVPAGSLVLVDTATLRPWFISHNENGE